MPLYTTRCHGGSWDQLELSRWLIILNWMSWKEFQSIERDFDNMYDGDYDISHYQTELILWDHTNKNIGLRLHN